MADAQIQAMQAQINALQAQIAQAAQAPPVAGPFVLTPTLVMKNVIDYSTASGQKLYKAAITGLETPFDGSPDNLPLFLADVKARANNSGWDALLTISDQHPVAPTDRNLITQHRMLSLENVKHAAQTYLGQQDRRAQNSHQMFEFLNNSLSEDTRKKMMTESEKYTVTVANDQSWMKQKPRPGQKTRTYKGKSFTWCEYHQKWTSHDVNGCRAKKKADEEKNAADKSGKEKKDDKSLELAKALVAITEEAESSLHE